MRTCTKCDVTKPETGEFFARHATGLRRWCRPCMTEYNRAYKAGNREAVNAQAAEYREANRGALAAKSRDYYAANREAANERGRAYSLKHEYGLSPGQYEDMLAAQGGACWICRRPPTGHRLRVDHCHDTGALRGLLCAACNSSLGTFGDNEEGLLRALEYLRSAPRRIAEVLPAGRAFVPRSRRHEYNKLEPERAK